MGAAAPGGAGTLGGGLGPLFPTASGTDCHVSANCSPAPTALADAPSGLLLRLSLPVLTAQAELLESAGVDTVKELRRRNADNRHAAMVETNATRNLMNQLPSAGQVQGFVDQAKEIEPMVSY